MVLWMTLQILLNIYIRQCQRQSFHINWVHSKKLFSEKEIPWAVTRELGYLSLKSKIWSPILCCCLYFALFCLYQVLPGFQTCFLKTGVDHRSTTTTEDTTTTTIGKCTIIPSNSGNIIVLNIKGLNIIKGLSTNDQRINPVMKIPTVVRDTFWVIVIMPILDVDKFYKKFSFFINY